MNTVTGEQNIEQQQQSYIYALSSTQARMMMILLEQLVHLLKLQITQPHDFTAVKASERGKILYFTIMYIMPFDP